MVRLPVTRAVLAPVVGSLLVATAACGRGESAPEPQLPVGAQGTTAAPSATPTPTETQTPSPTPTTRPLSRFEDEPPVIAARKWGAAVSRALNKRQADLADAKRYMTRAGQERFPEYASVDMGLYFPGPQPFTPTAVTVHGRQATIELCWWSYGFAQDRESRLPTQKRGIEPGRLTLKKQKGRWLVDDLVMQDGDCSRVPVKGVGW